MRNQESNKQIIISSQGEKKLLVVLGGGESGVGEPFLANKKDLKFCFQTKDALQKNTKLFFRNITSILKKENIQKI